jgi:feruloyl esterase
MVHDAVLGACDAIDGLKDGLIDDPRACKFDPQVLQCKAGDSASCLTPAQVESARKITTGPRDPRTGAEIYPALAHGTELGWATIAGGPEPRGNAYDHFKYVVFADQNWDWRTFNFETDLPKAEKIDNGLLNATDPNLSRFSQRGGKLLMYQGWSDQNIPPQATIKYYTSVLDKMGGNQKTSSWLRLFMAPGMGHCGGGEGPNTFDAVGAMDQWIQKGIAPDKINASHNTNGKVDRTRPLCPYPQVARYKGTGSIDEAANFECRQP